MDKLRLQTLIQCHYSGTLTDPEREELRSFVCNDTNAAQFQELVSQLMEDVEVKDNIAEDEWAAVLKDVMSRSCSKTSDHQSLLLELHPRKRSLWFWGRVAIAVLLLLTGAAFFWLRKNDNVEQVVQKTTITDSLKNIPVPGDYGATLTLEDGKKVKLDSIGTGLLFNQAGSNIVAEGGGLRYEELNNVTGKTTYNSITSGRGQEFKFVLPDGTMARLNASSSVVFPTSFSRNERRIEVTGEVYLDVVPDSKRPFMVSVEKQTVQVLGTSFNINAYDPEAIITTLVNGSLKVTDVQQRHTLIRPGEQAIAVNKGLSVRKANLEKELAWINGRFYFDGENLERIMYKLEQWYDITVVYEGAVPDLQLKGQLYRSITLNNLLNGFKKMGLVYRLDGRTLVIKPS